MRKTLSLLLFTVCLLFFSSLHAQEENKLKVSGSVDTYYKYDFSGEANIPTSFADEQNSISIGMIDILLEKSVGKASFVGEIAFGPRNAGSSGPGPENGFQPRIQNLYVDYALSDVISITAGYMGTFVGYEIISPTGNFNYSTSYLFTNGPFQNAGVKLNINPNDKFGIMVGIFNPWNVYTAPSDIGPSSLGAQIYLSPVEGWDAYLNFVTGGESGTEIDLTTTFQVNDALLIGLNAANYDAFEDGDAGFGGVAIYVNGQLVDAFALGARFERFTMRDAANMKTSVNALTISANIGNGPLTFIPEIRFDTASDNMFLDSSSNPTNRATQAVLAAVFSF